MTIGIVVVACRAAPSACVSGATMTSTLRSVAARAARREGLADAQRYSMVMFWPSIQPKLRSSCLHEEGFLLPIRRRGRRSIESTPILGMFFICWASAASNAAKAGEDESDGAEPHEGSLRHVWEDRQHAEA